MGDIKPVADPAVLIEQLRALIRDPDAFSAQRQEIIKLSRHAAVALEDPFEMFQRMAYAVRTPSPPRKKHVQCLINHET
jgi:hypothetical protein